MYKRIRRVKNHGTPMKKRIKYEEENIKMFILIRLLAAGEKTIQKTS